MVRRFSAVCLVFSAVASAQDVPAGRQWVVSPFGAAKARALMRDRLPCTGCHAFDGQGGGRIGPDLSQVADRRSAEYVRRMIEDPQGTVPGSIMPKVPMAGSTRELIIAYLTRGAAVPRRARDGDQRGTRDGRPAVPAATQDASALYGRYCTPCHGAQGRGDGPNAGHLPVRPAAHAEAPFMSRRSDDRLFDAIYAGGYPLGRSVAMPVYGETLTSAEIWSLVRHLRQLCRCSGPAWSADGDRVSSAPRPK